MCHTFIFFFCDKYIECALFFGRDAYHAALPVDSEETGGALELDGPVPEVVRRDLKPQLKKIIDIQLISYNRYLECKLNQL